MLKIIKIKLVENLDYNIEGNKVIDRYLRVSTKVDFHEFSVSDLTNEVSK